MDMDIYEDMRGALEDAYKHGRIERDTYMHLLDLIDEAEQDYDALEERMRVDRYTHAHMGGEIYDLKAENARLRDQLGAKEHNTKRNLREHRRVCEENDGLRELCLSMFIEHQRIFHAVSFMRTGASSAQMAHWYEECRKHGIEVDDGGDNRQADNREPSQPSEEG